MHKDPLSKWIDEYRETVLMTRNWARHIGAFVDHETGFHGYFTVKEWCDKFERFPIDFRRMKRVAFALKEPLTYDEFGGHYWGLPGSQAKTPLAKLKRVFTGAVNALDEIEIMQESGEWDACREVIKQGLEDDRRDLDIMDVVKLFESVGLTLPDDTRTKLLSVQCDSEKRVA